MSLIGDLYRYKVELILVDDVTPLEQLQSIHKKMRRDHDFLLNKAAEAYYDALKLAVNFLSPCNATRL